jgi:hypothetical protein
MILWDLKFKIQDLKIFSAFLYAISNIMISFMADILIKNSSKVQLFWNMQVFWAKKRRKNDGKDDFAFGFGHVFRVGGTAGEPFAGGQARHRGRHVG